ncbi:MAG: septum formation initiator family protein [Acutalibacteraceae bacterium]|nr:septum formation initiator family protein [Acutalibacteraceae bacterium]
MGKQKGSILLKIALLIFVVYLLYTVSALQVSLSQRKDKLAELQKTHASLEIENERLENLIKNGNEAEYIESIARQRLGYAYADEDIFVDASGR